MTGPARPEVVDVSAVVPEDLYDFKQKLIFSPARRGEGFIKFAVTTGYKGARSVPHSHPRDEIAMTLKGEAVLRAGGESYPMKEGIAVRLPPGLVHQVEVLSEEWVVVAAYCDECMLCRAPDALIPPVPDPDGKE